MIENKVTAFTVFKASAARSMGGKLLLCAALGTLKVMFHPLLSSHLQSILGPKSICFREKSSNAGDSIDCLKAHDSSHSYSCLMRHVEHSFITSYCTRDFNESVNHGSGANLEYRIGVIQAR